jgi:hypothetical protein
MKNNSMNNFFYIQAKLKQKDMLLSTTKAKKRKANTKKQ